MTSTQIDVGAVDRFLASHRFATYQRVPLPHGREIPGRDREPTAQVVLSKLVPGASVLDIGANYGYFSLAAVERGAARVVALEPDPERATIAAEVSRLHGEPFEVRRQMVEDFEGETFDTVLLLNVLHHAADPAALMRKVRSLAQRLVVVQFRDHLDGQLVRAGSRGAGGPFGRATAKVARIWRTTLLHAVTRDVGVIGVGERGYYHVMYFSPTAFEAWFVTHLQLFSRVEFASSLDGTGGQIAFCWV